MMRNRRTHARIIATDIVLQGDSKVCARFTNAESLNPEILFDKNNEPSDYFEKEFLR